MSATDGGPAFPYVETDETRVTAVGATMRDYFAAKAMQALIGVLKTETNTMGEILPTQWRPVVSGAFKIADEMIREREAQP